MKIKKILSFVVAIAIVLTTMPAISLPVSAETATSGSLVGNCTWTLNGSVLTISGNGETGEFIYNSAPWGTDIEKVIINNGLTRIGESAFEGCSALTTIAIPSSVTSIGNKAFKNCSSLTEIVIPNGVTRFGGYVFSGCSALKKITLPSGITDISYGTFQNCSSLTGIEIPNGIKTIGTNTFSGCSSLTNVTLPSSLTNIGWAAFENCSLLEKITIPSEVTTISGYAFSGCKKLSEITIPKGVTKIESSTFYGCSSLANISILGDVTDVGSQAFYGCGILKGITLPQSVTNIGYRAFYNCSSLSELVIPSGVINIESATFYGCSSLTKVTIPNNLTKIDEYAFYGCTLLYDIAIPNSVASIGRNAFSLCDSLTEVEIPNGVTSINEETFLGCVSLTEVVIPNSVTNIGDSAFSNCWSLANITIPNSVTGIGVTAFYRCYLLKDFIIPNGVTNIEFATFGDCNSLITIAIPNSVTSIGQSAFENCSSLTEVVIPNSVESVGMYCFRDCELLVDITIPNSVKSIGQSAFYECSSLENIYYYGTKNEWDSITGINNSFINTSKTTIHYCSPIFSEADCTNDGVAGYSCSCCDYEKTVITPALGHQVDAEGVVTPPTSTDFGYTTYTCSRCGESYKTDWTEPTESVSGACGEDAVWAFNESTGVLTLDGTGAVDAYTSVTAPWNIYSNQIYAVDIRSDITAIGDDAFSACNKIVEIKNDSAIQLEKGSAANGGVAKNTKNIYSSSSGQSRLTYQDDFVFITDGEDGYLVDYKGSQTVLELPEEYVAYNGKTIASYALLDYSLSLKSTLSKVILPSSVVEIGKYTFVNSTAITDFYIYDYNCNIFDDAATLLNTATIHGYYGSTAEEYANTYGNQFVSVTVDFPYGVCGDTATWSLNPDTGVLTVSGSGSISDYEQGVAPWYAYKDDIESVYVDSGITKIGNYAFYGLSNVTYIDLGNTLKTIGANAFENCSIKNITLPETISEIGSSAFKGCTSLENIIIPDNVTEIKANTFNGCTTLKSVTIGAGVRTIDSTSFEGCTAITTVKMRGAPPTASVGVFGAASQKYVYYYDTITAWNDAITDGLWNGYTMLPYSIVSEIGFDGNNVFAIKVVDKYNEPITNATVSFGSVVKSTNNDGFAYFVNNDNTCELSVSASGFASFSDSNYTVNNGEFVEFIVLSDSPSTITGVSCNGKSIATSIVKFNCNSSDDVTISVSGNSPRTILKYELLQGNRVISTAYSSNNRFDFTVKANHFEEGEAVLAKMYISDGTYVAAALNIQPLHIATVTAEGLLGSKDSTNINLPLIGSFPFNLEMAGIASTSIVLEEDTIKVGFNIEISEDMSDTAIQKAIKEAKEKSKILSAKPKNEITGEVAGYIEIKYLGNDEYVITESSVSVAFITNLEASLQASYAGVIGVYFTAGITSKGELELKLIGYDVEEGFESEELYFTLENALKIEGGVYLLWGAGKAGFYGKGEAGVTVEVAPEFGLEHVYIKGDVGVNWSVLWGWIKGSRSIWKGILFEEPENYEKIRMLYSARVNSILNDPNNYVLNDRAYLSERSEWLGENTLKTRNTFTEYYSNVQENVYYNIAPKIVTCNGTTMMVWLDDNAERDINNYQTLYYSIYNADLKTWSEPIQIDNNDTFDCEFDLIADGNDIYVVYTEKTALESNIENFDIENEEQIVDLIDDVEVRVCKFNGQGFSQSVSLTSNTDCETLPKLQVVDGVLTVMWSTLEPLGISGVSSRENAIYSSQLTNNEWSYPTVLVENSHQILSIAKGELEDGAFTAYIVDTDGKNETGTDYALILADEDGNYKQISSGLIMNLEFTCVNGVNVLMWCDDSNIYYLTSSNESKKQFFADSKIFDGSFKTVKIDDETILVAYVAANEDSDGTDVYGVYFDGEAIIGFPFKMTNTAGYVDDFGVVYQDNSFIVSFIETSAEFVDEEIITTSDFKYLILPHSSDVIISTIDYDITAVTPGETFEVTIFAENIGNAMVNGLNIYLYDNNYELVSSAQYNQTVLPGDIAEINALFTAPTMISNENYYVEVMPIDLNDKDTSNNKAELLLGYADLSVKIKQKNIGNKRFLLFSVTNNGNIDANADIPVYRDKDGEIITSINDAFIKAGETEEYLVDASTIDGDTLVYAKLETQEYDPYSLNDNDLIPVIQLTFVDYNENVAPNPVLSTTGVEYNKYSNSTVEIMIEQGADKFIGIDGLTENVEYMVNGSVVTLASDYLQTLPNGSKQLKFLFDYQLETSISRTIIITVLDSSPTVITGSVKFDGEPNVGNTLYADLTELNPHTNSFDYVWAVGNDVVSTGDSYTVKAEDYGKIIKLTVTAKDGFIGSFSNSATVGYNEPVAPVSPVIVLVKDTSVELIAVDGIEYSLDGVNWQASNVFDNLLPNTEYTFYARLKATETTYASSASAGVYAKTLKSVVSAPTAPSVESKTDTTIVLNAVTGYEYRCNDGEWQSSNVFTGLSIYTEYKFYQRIAESDTNYVSDSSVALVEKTNKQTVLPPSAPEIYSKTHSTITLVPDASTEYKIEGGEWTDNNVFANLEPDTSYVFYQRYKETDTAYASAYSSAILTTDDKISISGTIAINGEPQFRETLTIDLTGFIGDTNSVSYQWYSDGVAISGATQEEYIITEDDMGREISVTITGIGSYKGDLTAFLSVRNYVIGDVDGDNEVTIRDATILRRYVAKWDGVTISSELAADIDHDGFVTIRDATTLRRYVAKWEGYESLFVAR